MLENQEGRPAEVIPVKTEKSASLEAEVETRAF